MKSIARSERSVICQNPDSPFYYFGWPSIDRLPDGALAMAASGYRLEHVCPFGKAIIAYSYDEGESWTRPAPVIDTPLDDRDAGIVPFGAGRVIFTSFNNAPGFQRRANAPRHADASPVVRARARLIDAYLDYIEAAGDPNRYVGSTYRLSEDGGYTFGPIMISPVTSPHGPMRMNDGSLMWIGRRFDDSDEFDSGERPYIECWHMDADGSELKYVSSIENVRRGGKILLSCEPHAVQLADGRIIVHIRVQGGEGRGCFTIYQSVSDDGGKSFSAPVQLLGDRGGSPAHLIRHSSGALISAYGYREAPYGVRAMFSRDRGESWDTDWVLDDGGQSGDLGYPATVELRDGALLIIWYENRDGRSDIIGRKWRLPEKWL